MMPPALRSTQGAPVFERTGGRKGRLSIQTNPTFHVSTERMLDQARHFATLAPNVQVKFPVTAAGLRAIEEATYEGISINATVSFTLDQQTVHAHEGESILNAALRHGVERIKTVGEIFDPRLHEAVSMDEGDGPHENSIEVVCEELQPGYRIGDDIIRHALVKVKKERE